MDTTMLVAQYLSDGTGGAKISELALTIAKTNDPEKLAVTSFEIYTAIAKKADAPHERIVVVGGAAYLAEYHAALYSEQKGKQDIQRWSAYKPVPWGKDHYYDFEKKEWVHVYRAASNDRWQDYEIDTKIARLEHLAKENSHESQWDFRWESNKKDEKKWRKRFEKSLDECGFLFAAQRAGRIAELVSKIPVQHTLPRSLILEAAHLHVLGLYTRAKAFVARCRMQKDDEYIITQIGNVFEEYEREIKYGHGSVRDVSSAYVHTITGACVDVMHDIQGFVQKKLREIHQTELLIRIEKRLAAIQVEMEYANTQLAELNRHARYSNRLAEEQRDLSRRGLMGIGALGVMLGSFHVDMRRNTSFGGIFGGSSQSTRANGSPEISFLNAYACLEAAGDRGMVMASDCGDGGDCDVG